MITKTAIQKAKAGDVLHDDYIRGLGLYIGANKKTWRVYYRVKDTRQQRRYQLGYYPILSLTDARELAREVLVKVAKGIDPAEVAGNAKLEYVYEQYVESSSGKLKPKTLSEYHILWSNHIQPQLGSKGIRSIKRSDISELHSDVGGYQANRVLSLISRLYSFAYASGYLDAEINPTRGVERNEEVIRTRCATNDELATIGLLASRWLLLPTSPERQFSRLIQAILLTGSRSGEWLKAEKSWIDFEAKLLRLPDSKTGAKNISLPDNLLQTLKDACNESKGTKVFDTDAGVKLYDKGLWQKFKAEGGLGDLRIHDLRRSYASYGLSSGVGMEHISKLLGHSSINTTETVYAHLLPDARKEAANKISDALMKRLKS